MVFPSPAHTCRCACLIALVACGARPPPPAPPDTHAYDAIAASIRDEIATGRLTGVAVALVHRGRIVWEDGFGWADREANRKATSRTPFSIASLTKSFTTTAVMTLVATGKLALDQPANDYLGTDKIVDGHGPTREVTLRRLASHSSGLPVLFAMYPDGDQPSVGVLLRDYGRIVAPVGERYEYSNIGMAALAEIVARQSGEEFGAYLQRHVLAPLGLTDSFFDTDVARRAAMAARYNDDGSPFPFYVTATPGSGEMYASAHDLARYAMFHLEDAAFAGNSVLTTAHLDELHRPVTPVEPPVHMYALGWRVARLPGNTDVLYHGGGQLGVAANLTLLPAHDAACIVLSNRRNNRPFIDGLCDRLLRTVVPSWQGLPATPDAAPQPLPPPYAGAWRGELVAQRRHIPIRLTIDDGGHGRLAIAGARSAPITDLGLLNNLLVGSTTGDIASPDVRRNHLTALSLKLKLRGSVLDGEIIASSPDATLPHWVELRRHP